MVDEKENLNQQPIEENVPGEYMNTEFKKQKGNWWQRKTKAQKGTFIATMIILAISLIFATMFFFLRTFFPNNQGIADAVYGKDVPNGFVFLFNVIKSNYTKVIFSVMIAVFAFVIGFLLDLVVKLITSSSRKATTTGSLIRSLIKYAVVLVGVAAILMVWNVNVVGIIASLGVMTLIIGLGCQSLISDIISGLFIVFDDYFDVGDMVIIDGFRGYVEEIGLRTVKLNDNCGNIKSITNSSINTCVNLSRHPNYISITLEASYFEDVERLEGIFARELPKIKERLPQIIDGPWYKGVDGFTNAGVSYTFACTCLAQYRFQVARDFKREIYQMFVNNDILIPFEQLVINQPDPKDRPKANAKELKDGKALIDNNRKLQGDEKKVKFTKRIRKAVEETASSIEETIR